MDYKLELGFERDYRFSFYRNRMNGEDLIKKDFSLSFDKLGIK